MPKCKHCITKFEARYFNQKYCLENPECISASTKFALATVKKQLEAKKKKDDSDRRKDTAERKKALLSHKDWLAKLQTVFNAFIRERDKENGCISCETKANIQYAAGHYFTVGGFSNVRFDEDNVHLQCNKRCNGEMSGNIIEYRPRLIRKIGIERFEALEFRARNESGKLTIPEIEEKIKYYREKIKQLKLKQ